MKNILLAIVISTTIIGGGIVALVIFGPKTEVSDAARQTFASELPDPFQKKASIDPSKSVAYNFDDSFITNVKNSNRYLKINITLELSDNKSREFYEKNSFKVKDAIIGVLRSKTEADLLKDTAQQDLKDGIKTALSERLQDNRLIDVYINEFIIQ